MDNAQLATDDDWDDMEVVAKYQQQEYYELLPDWTKYYSNEYIYLKQNIGFSIFGPPRQSTTSDISETQMVQYNENVDDGSSNVTDTICYEPKAQAVINEVFQKIYEFGHGSIDAECIYYGIIFNVTLPLKSESLKKQEICINTTPVFKIKRSKSDNGKNMEPVSYKIWYIDIGGRVYKSWSDYKTFNTLPKCRMFLPKSGFYRPDKSHEITETSSKVWLEEADSPACATTRTVLRTIDTVANVAGVAGLVLGVAALFTPAAPIAIGAAAATGGTAAWNFGRSSHNLIDRSVHEESINPFANRTAFCSWLSITGSMVGIAASGGSTLLTNAIRNGAVVNTAARVGYNSIIIGNLSINGFGMAYQAYCIYEEYQEHGRISTLSLLNLGAHILFFGNAVINIKLAGNLIESTQGQILDEYRNTIRSKRLKSQFNRARRSAAENNTGKSQENAEVIKYIKDKYEVWQKNNISVPDSYIPNSNIITFENGIIKINNMALIDPMQFVSILLEADRHRNETSSSEDFDLSMDSALRNLLLHLLESFKYAVYDIENYANIFMDLNHMPNALKIFSLLFKLAIILIRECRSVPDCLAKAVHFLWSYVKENLKRKVLDINNSINNPNAQAIVEKFINCMFENADTAVQSMIPAFVRYICRSG